MTRASFGCAVRVRAIASYSAKENKPITASDHPRSGTE